MIFTDNIPRLSGYTGRCVKINKFPYTTKEG